MTKYFDKSNNRLVFVNEKAVPKFWDNQWLRNIKVIDFDKLKINKWDYVIKNTRKYLPKNSKILEGGCGNGNQVLQLSKAGYDVVGLDYAEKTIDFLKENYPKFNFTLGDVRQLPFENEYFDGYWSFGVIEHFYNGYAQIANEMKRVIKSGGYLFLTFPHLSKLRKLKAEKNKYPLWNESDDLIDKFYQFALDENKVIENFNSLGFELVSVQHLSGIKGLKDEKESIKPFLQKIYNNRTILGTIGRQSVNILFNKFSSHSILCVFRKK